MNVRDHRAHTCASMGDSLMALRKPTPRVLNLVELHQSELSVGPVVHGKHQGLDRVLFIGQDGDASVPESLRKTIMAGDDRFDQAGRASFSPLDGDGELTLRFLSKFNSVLLWADFCDVAVDNRISSVLKDYVDHGGGVVISTFWGLYQSLGGDFTNNEGINSHGYNPLVDGTDDTNSRVSLGEINDPTSPLMDGVKSIASKFYHADYLNVDEGAHLVASWNNGRPLVAVNEAGSVANVTLFPGGVSPLFGRGITTGDASHLLMNALDFVAGDPTGIK
jgi:hypothetical protein